MNYSKEEMDLKDGCEPSYQDHAITFAMWLFGKYAIDSTFIELYTYKESYDMFCEEMGFYL